MQKQYHQRTTYAPENPEECEKGTLSNWPRLSHITSTALLSCWGRQLLKYMTSLGTDFEMHAIWQGYVEDTAAKDFIARKARTIALSKARGTRQSTLFTSLEISWGFHTQAVLCSLAGLMSCKKVSVRGFFVSKKGLIRVCPTNVCTRYLRQKVERGKITNSESTTRFPRASCFEEPMHSVPESWGRMYNVPA